jgi:hypothetical protein
MFARLLVPLLASLLATAAPAQTTHPDHPDIPNTVPTKFVNGQWLIRASVNGDENWYVLSTEARTSVLVGTGTSTRVSDVKISEADAGNISFRQSALPELKAIGASGILGRDVLSHLNLAIDVEEAVVYVWVEQQTVFHEIGWLILAPTFSNDSQHAARLSIWDSDNAPYCVKGSVGGRAGLIEIGIGAPADVAETSIGPDNSLELLGQASSTDIVDGLMVDEIGPFWTIARPVTAKELPGSASKQVASLPIERFPARRFVFDGPSGVIIAEELGVHARNALGLSHLLGMPIEIDDDLILGRAAGSLYGDAATKFAGATIVTIAGHTSAEIVEALNGTADARMAMLANLASARAGGIQVRYVRDGTPYETVLRAKTS